MDNKNITFRISELAKLHADIQKIFNFIGNHTAPEFFEEKIALHECFEEELNHEVAWLISRNEESDIRNIGFQSIQFYPASYSDLDLLKECKMHLHLFSVNYHESLMLDFLPKRTYNLLNRQLFELKETINSLNEMIQESEDKKMAV
jgi:hypothetical protein